MRIFGLLLLATSLSAFGQGPTAVNADSLGPLDFLLGTWTAKTSAPDGSSAAAVSGTYTFARDLNGHELVRTTSLDKCKGPAAFDCQHHDQLVVFADANARAVHGVSLLAFYADSEGHIIYYTITTPDPHTVIFNSQNAPAAPKFKLVYHLEGSGPKAIMTGKFQMAAPGSDDYHSYLEWSGTRQ